MYSPSNDKYKIWSPPKFQQFPWPFTPLALIRSREPGWSWWSTSCKWRNDSIKPLESEFPVLSGWYPTTPWGSSKLLKISRLNFDWVPIDFHHFPVRSRRRLRRDAATFNVTWPTVVCSLRPFAALVVPSPAQPSGFYWILRRKGEGLSLGWM